jgi:hypothetical protein
MRKVPGRRADRFTVNRIHRTGLAALLLALTAVAAACAPARPAPEPEPTPTTAAPTTAPPTTAPTTTSTTSTTSSTTTTTAAPSPQQLCLDGLETFVQEANANTYTSPAYSIAFTGAAPLDNPDAASSPTHPGAPSSLSIGITVYDQDGSPITPSPSQPLHVNVYGGGTALSSTPAALGTSTDPLTVEITSGSGFTLDYDGSFLAAPITIQGAMELGAVNGCTGTASWSIGATTVPLLNTLVDDGSADATLPAYCNHDPADDGTCASTSIGSTGVRLRAAFGYAEGWPTSATAPPAVSPHADDYDAYTVDTGSIGAAAPIDQLGPNAVGPAGPAFKYYDSSGYEYMGFLYLAPVTIRDASGSTISTIPIRVLGVESSGCVPGHRCTSDPDPDDFHYLGVGFDRNTPNPPDQLASPTDNALLQLKAPSGHYAPGYIVDGAGVEVGLTPSQVAGFGTADLTASSSVLGDWNTAPGLASIDASQTTPASASTILVDTGITDMFFDAGDGTGFDHLDASDWVNLLLPTTGGVNQLDYGFQAGTGHTPAATGMNPSTVSLIHLQPPGSVFVNTGRYVLFENRYLFDARKGRVGFSPQTTPRPT